MTIRALVAAGDDLGQVQAELTAERCGRLRRLLAADPAIAVEVRRLLDEELGPALSAAYPGRPDIRMNAIASDNGRVYQAGRDITINRGSGRPERLRLRKRFLEHLSCRYSSAIQAISAASDAAHSAHHATDGGGHADSHH